MNYRLTFLLAALLAAFSFSAIIFVGLASRLKPYRLLLFLVGFSLTASAQSWSPFLNPSRAVDWTSAGSNIPNYTANCAIQPSLGTGSGAASANTTSIQNALNSCDATHNVVNIPAGNWYIQGITYGTQGKQVLRGAGPNATTLLPLSRASCIGVQGALCMIDDNPAYSGSSWVLPPTGPQQCTWSGTNGTVGTYTKGATTLNFTNCGGAPPLNGLIILDSQNDTTDTHGVYICDASTGSTCTQEGNNGPGRVFSNGIKRSTEQVVYTTGVTSLGGGAYTVTIATGLYFNNVRTSQNPGVWWAGTVQNDGLENLSIDGSTLGPSTDSGTLTMIDCYQCWAKNVRFMYGGRHHIEAFQSANDVIRDSYLYAPTTFGATSYGIEVDQSSGLLVENNIFQQVIAPLMFGTGTGFVIGYNFSVYHYGQAPYYSHTAGDQMGLWEGNDFLGIWTDAVHGSSATGTVFRNFLPGKEPGVTYAMMPLNFRANHRGNNFIGNVLGQPGWSTTYETYATSTTGGVNASTADTSIFEFGWTDYSGIGVCTQSSTGGPPCDPLVKTTSMRWGNYDVVNNAVRWDSTEASPAAVPFISANFSSGYFSTLAHTLPASLYYNSKPSWWPSGKAWPAIGPDVSSGNLGFCSGGSYSGAQATSSGQCTGGTLSAAWANHATSLPAQDCFLNVMHGSPDGSGSVLSFDARQCYGSSGSSGTGPGSPSGLTATVQ